MLSNVWPPTEFPTLPKTDQCVGYVENNRSRMRYPAYRAMELLIGSGMVEAPATRWSANT